MKILVTGVHGQLGHDVMNELAGRGYEGLGTDIFPLDEKDGGTLNGHPYVQLDITDREAVHALFRESRPDAVVHCAAWTNVDGAEDPGNRDKVYGSAERERNPGIRTAKTIVRSIITGRPNWKARRRSAAWSADSLLCGSPGYSASTAATLSKQCCVWDRHMTRCAW